MINNEYKKLIIIVLLFLNVIYLFSCKKEMVTIKYEVNGGNPVNDQIIYKDENYVHIIPEKEGYYFIGWFKDLNFDNKTFVCSNTVFTNDTCLYAKWEIKEYIVDVQYGKYEKRYYAKYNEELILEECYIDGFTYKFFYYNDELIEGNKIIVKNDMFINVYYEEILK